MHIHVQIWIILIFSEFLDFQENNSFFLHVYGNEPWSHLHILKPMRYSLKMHFAVCFIFRVVCCYVLSNLVQGLLLWRVLSCYDCLVQCILLWCSCHGIYICPTQRYSITLAGIYVFTINNNNLCFTEQKPFSTQCR